jgi:NAD(P)-dependent dehydrogenase (short-subunit alcohol dehydrogenase family)
MQIRDKVAVVTGGGNGIGRALCRRFAAEGARAVVVADLRGADADAVAKEISGMSIPTDVASEAAVKQLVQQVMREYGAIDLFCSNAGLGVAGGAEAPDVDWQRSWEINVMAHVYAARAVLPAMLARGQGYLLQTVSAAGLLTQIGSAPYSVTKHAALGFAEWIAITHGDQGIKVSALCPMGVRTNMLFEAQFAGGAFLLETAVEPEQAADEVVKGLADERFLILPHPEVAEFFRRKANDYDRWLKGMRKLQASSQILKPSGK